jgi:hypothetical protein
MPSDVPLGAGYVGDALFTRFPGQYRDSEQSAAGRGFFDFPGNHGPVYRDPDNGRRLELTEVPGVGQVVVPVDHSVAAIVPVEHTMAAVYPSDHVMAGLEDLGHDDPRTPHGKMHWHAKLVAALDASAHEASAPKQLMVAFNVVAQMAVQRALEKAQRCRFKTPEQAVAFVKSSIISAAASFKPMVQRVAFMVAESASKAAAPALKKAWCAPGSKRSVPRRPGPPRIGGPRPMDDWPGSMFGMNGIGASIANLAAGSELDDLARNIRKLVDAIVVAYNQVTALQQQEAAAQAFAPAGAPAPGDELYTQYLSAMKSVNEGYKALTGFDYMTQVIANVFTPNAPKLESVYSGLTGILGQIRNWNSTWQSQIGNSHPEMVQLWDAIQNEHNRLWSQAKTGPFSYDDPAYLTTASQAVQNVTGVKPADADSGLSDFGITALIGVIVVAIAAVAVAVAVYKIAQSFNTVANNIADQRKQYETQMAKQHDDYIAQAVSEGKDVQTAEQEWLQLKAQYDAQEAQKEHDYSKDAPSSTNIGKYIAYAAGAVGVAVALPHVLKLVGIS